MLFVTFAFLILSSSSLAQRTSPCPRVFSYEPRSQEEDRWYGVISLKTEDDLDGIWLKIVLDRPAELLGNWFGEATSTDNQEYTIQNSKYKLEAGPSVSVRFFVKYSVASTIPSLMSIKLNGKTICNANSRENEGPTTPKLHISRPEGSRPNTRPGIIDNNYSNNHNRPNSNGNSYVDEKPTWGTSHGSGETYGSNSQERPGYGASSQNGHKQSNSESSQSQSPNRRPGNTHSNPTTQNTNHRDRETTSSFSSSNSQGLSVTGEVANINDNDFFPGDFAFHRPSHTRPPPTIPTIVAKREVACGTVAMRPSPLISYGQNTSKGQWPWHAALYHSQGPQLMYTCGGTLISDSHVLTAAHCVAKPQSNRPVDPSRLTVYLGKYSLNNFGDDTQNKVVSDIFIHPQYNYSVYFNDIALIKFTTPADFTHNVRPCCLWSDDTNLDHLFNSEKNPKYGTVVGWGFDEKRQISDKLTRAQMPIVSTVKCIYSNREFFSQFTFEKTYCAGFRNGTTVCNGDSGGGMVFPKNGTSGDSSVWQIRGIVSVGVALQGQGVCDPRHYIVFTDVAKHLDWIKQKMRE